ncbi:hypothetical protein ES707_19209 [subsurface metagenome]
MKRLIIPLSILTCFLITFTSCSSQAPAPAQPAPHTSIPTEQPKEEVGKPTEQEPRIKQKTYSNMALIDVSVVGNKVVISGSTDLPDGTNLIVDFDVWGRPNNILHINVLKDATVSQGKFKAELIPPQREEYTKGSYEISVLCTPNGQPEEVQKLIGKDGENLSGSLVRAPFGFNVMELIEKKDLQLFITSPSYVFQEPPEFEQGTAERTLAEYAWAWKNEDWGAMTNYAQKTWVSNEKDPAVALKDQYGWKYLRGFEITGVNKVSDVVTDITFIVQYEAIAGQILRAQITARCIKETAPYTPSEQGRWGVNPLSTIREEYID